MIDALVNLINRSEPEAFLGMFFVFGTGGIVLITAIIGGLIYKHRARELDASLKHAMIERGMSADEIERVLKCSSKGLAPEQRSQVFNVNQALARE